MSVQDIFNCQSDLVRLGYLYAFGGRSDVPVGMGAHAGLVCRPQFVSGLRDSVAFGGYNFDCESFRLLLAALVFEGNLDRTVCRDFVCFDGLALEYVDCVSIHVTR